MSAKTMAGILDPGSPFDDRLGEVTGDTGSGEDEGRDGNDEPRRVGQKDPGEEDRCRDSQGKSTDGSLPRLVGTDERAELVLAISSTDVIRAGIRSRCDGSQHQEPAPAFGEEAQTEDKGAQHPEVNRTKGHPTEEIIAVGKICIGSEGEKSEETEGEQQPGEGTGGDIPCHHGREKRQGEEDIEQDSLQERKPLAASHPHVLIGGPDCNDGNNRYEQGNRTFEEEKKPAESNQDSGNDSFH